jgi:predicted ATPase
VLSSELGDTPRLFPALWGLWLFYWGRGPLSTASELVHDLLELAHRDGGDVTLLQAHHAAWATSLGRGDLEAVCAHATAGLTVYQVDRHAALAATYGSHDAAACAHNFASWALALRGRVHEAARASTEAIALAERLGHPFSIALTHFFAAATAQTLRDGQAARACAAVALRIAREQDFRLVAAWALTLEGWTAIENGDITGGLDQIDNAIAEVKTTGATQFLPYFLGLKASAHLRSGEGLRGLHVIDEALAMVRNTGECFWESELYRVKGELLLVSNGADADHQAERAFLHGLEIARRQRADLIALRTAVSLSRLWCRLGRPAEAGELLAASMTTVADTTAPDVADASALLASF